MIKSRSLSNISIACCVCTGGWSFKNHEPCRPTAQTILCTFFNRAARLVFRRFQQPTRYSKTVCWGGRDAITERYSKSSLLCFSGGNRKKLIQLTTLLRDLAPSAILTGDRQYLQSIELAVEFLMSHSRCEQHRRSGEQIPTFRFQFGSKMLQPHDFPSTLFCNIFL